MNVGEASEAVLRDSTDAVNERDRVFEVLLFQRVRGASEYAAHCNSCKKSHLDTD